MAYYSRHTGEEIDSLLEQISEGVIVEVDSSLSSTSKNPVQNKVVTSALANKQEKLISGTTIKTINSIPILGAGNIVISGGGSNSGVSYEEVEQMLQGKQDSISDLADIREGASLGATAIQREDLASVATSGSYNDLKNKPTIPVAVTESTVSGWGFTKNTGTYTKPSGGIPKDDMASGVQASLNRADTALQSYTEIYRGTITGVKMNGVVKGTSGQVDLGTVITEHQDISGKQDVIADLDSIRKKANSAIQSIPDEYVTSEELESTISSKGFATESWVEGKGYLTEHQDISKKQDVILDLAAIRAGAAKGATALQSVPDTYVTDDELASSLGSKQDTLVSGVNLKTINGTSLLGGGNVVIAGEGGISYDDTELRYLISNKVDKVEGKELSTNDFTDEDKAKLDSLENYDDTSVVSLIRNKQDKLVSGSNIRTINGTSILGGGDLTIEQGETLTEQDIAAMGFTKNTGTVTAVKINGDTKNPSSGVVDLGTVITEHQDISGLAGFCDYMGTLTSANTSINLYPSDTKVLIVYTLNSITRRNILTGGTFTINQTIPPLACTIQFINDYSTKEILVTTPDTADRYNIRVYANFYDAGIGLDKQDILISGTNIKTINGESILGEGDLIIESNNGSAVVVHDASETEVELTPNVIHRWEGATSLSLTVPEDPDGMVYSYKAVFVVASSAFSLSLPYNLRWVNSTMPVFEYGKQYEISIEGGRVLWAMFDEPAIEGEELPWIENDGTDYILTDYYPDANDVKQSVKFSVLETLTHHQCIVGTSESSTLPTTKIAIWALSNNGNILQYFDAASTTLSSSATVGQVYEFSGESTAATKLNASRPLVVFNLNSSSMTSTNAAHARFYCFRLYDASGKVTLDLRPFKRTSDGAIGVLDAVSGTFYPSANGNLTEGA